MWNKSFIIIVFSSFFLACIALWRASVGPSAERMMESVLFEMNKKPEVIARITIEGMSKLQKKQEEEDRLGQIEKVRSKKQELLKDKKSPFSGNPEGDIVVLVFFDYHCGFCRTAHSTVEKLLAKDKNLKVIYKEYPIFGDLTLSRAALAAHKQGKYQDFHTILMKSDGTFTREALVDLARKLKLNVKKFNADMNSLSIENQVKANMTLGRSLDITATPTFVIGDTVIPGALPLEDFQKEIRKERVQKSN
ncbi:DsbA family protein [Alphaproteobacteria bacterium]|nr:DsbA family protein [Alphaproteobacteria bacterium]